MKKAKPQFGWVLLNEDGTYNVTGNGIHVHLKRDHEHLNSVIRLSKYVGKNLYGPVKVEIRRAKSPKMKPPGNATP